MAKVVGSSLPRVEGYAKVTGGCLYAADYQRPGTLWGKVLRSPVPHARILNVDTSRVQSLPGVRAVITANDMPPRLIGATLKDMPMLARDRVRFIGEEIAAVAAVDKDVAEEAVGLIDVEYEELPAVFDPLDAIKQGAPVLHPDYASYEGPKTMAPDLHNIQTVVRGGKGDIEQGFRESDQVFENTFRVQMVHQAYIEPYACTVEVDSEGRVA
ncbi:MAG: molybdopterin-dependent oxidoreductase, partial [Deltaproteobacteria bacterium]|nr:molybdopterin-dependent oxidoreductase [Deltaproteobacteria bacterium]